MYSLRVCNLKKVFMIWKSFRLHNYTCWSPRSFRSPSPNLPVVPFVSSCPTLAFQSPITYSTSPLGISSTTCCTVPNNSSIYSSSAVDVGAYTCKTVMFRHPKDSAYYHLFRIANIRASLTTVACKTLVHALVISRVDYGNALLYGITDRLLHRLEMIQHSAARIIMCIKRHDRQSITAVLRQLHWLPVKWPINYKIVVLVFRALHGLAPAYVSTLITPYEHVILNLHITCDFTPIGLHT